MSAPFYAPGRYACKITEQALGKAATGTPQFVLRFRVMGLVNPTDPSQYIPAAQQYERTFYGYITEKAVPYLVEDLKTLGFQGSSFRDLDPNTPGFHDFRDRDVDMFCDHDDDTKGGKKEKWSIARTSGALDVRQLEPKEARDLDNLFGKHLKGLNGGAGKPQAQTQQPAAAMATSMGITDDDVPF